MRERNAASTRDAVMRAVIDLVVEEPFDRVTMPVIAEAAGISLRTLYRYYPDREALSLALGRWVDENLLRTGLPTSAESIAAQMDEVGARFEEHVALVRALVGSGEGERSPRRNERLAAIESALGEQTRQLAPADRHRLVALVQLLASAPAWLSLREEGELEGAEAGAALAWAIRSLLDAATRNEEIEKGAAHVRAAHPPPR